MIHDKHCEAPTFPDPAYRPCRCEERRLRADLASVREKRDDFARDVLRLLDTIKYLRGIGVRGEGREPRDGETTEAFVLRYVRRIEAERAAAITELENIALAKRFNRDLFADDTEFADWAQSRCRHALDDGRAEEPSHG